MLQRLPGFFDRALALAAMAVVALLLVCVLLGVFTRAAGEPLIWTDEVARLLGVPARYVCGYIYTGNTGTTRASSDETHAWIELYIPHIGWKGFDPTNGVLPQTDHVRVAVGRHYRDATPTAGTPSSRPPQHSNAPSERSAQPMFSPRLS
jgi:hypothetical protein